MKTLPLTALALAFAASAAAPALAQDDGANRLEPYVGVMGGLHDFDNDQYNGAPPSGYRGWLVEGVAGANYNLGKLVIGAEGTVAKGVDKDINWEFGAAGRLGVKAGKDSMFFAKAGYQWTKFSNSAQPAVSTSRAYDGTVYGIGFELSAADLNSTAERSNWRLRGQIDTRGDFHSFRPMLGVVAKF
ncbi:MAG TPA: outer membrane beta-barrel protein [Sphingobium sp.]|nr:outer membrane beta-barrel protein [Sphingobium sp.]